MADLAAPGLPVRDAPSARAKYVIASVQDQALAFGLERGRLGPGAPLQGPPRWNRRQREHAGRTRRCPVIALGSKRAASAGSRSRIAFASVSLPSWR